MSHRSFIRGIVASTILLWVAPARPAAAQHAIGVTSKSARSLTGVRFQFLADGPVRGGFGLAAGRLLFGTEAGSLYAIDARTGALRWRHAVGSPILSTPAILGSTAYFTTWDDALHAVDLATGRERWRETHDGGSWILGLEADTDRFYSGSGSAFIMQAADPATGKAIWRTPTANAMFGGIAKAGDVLISNGINGVVAGFDVVTGAQRWRFSLPDTVFSSPLAAPGVIYTGADDGSVFALETSSALPVALDRSIYSFTDEPAQSAFWFKPEAKSAIRAAFLAAGYSSLGNADFVQALASPVTKNGRRVIVLADSRLPDSVEGKQLRSFLDQGGTLVMLGIDPLVYSFGADGAPAGVDEDRAKAAFGLDRPDKQRDFGYNVSKVSAAGERLGLYGRFVALGWAKPAQVTTIFARDRTGNATAWVKRFANGGALIELPVPRNRSGELSRYANAVDFAAAGSGGAR
jgi:hypothetical protein